MTDIKRHPRADALKVAQELYALILPYCDRCKVVGSLRRRRSTVKDIEFLIIPHYVDGQKEMFCEPEKMDACAMRLEELLKEGVIAKRPSVIGTTAWGPRNKFSVHTASGIAVDFFSTTEAGWWMSMVIRTGGKETNVALATSALKRGLRLHAYGDGFTEIRTGRTIPCSSEKEVFKIAGITFSEPHLRK